VCVWCVSVFLCGVPGSVCGVCECVCGVCVCVVCVCVCVRNRTQPKGLFQAEECINKPI